MTKIKIIFIGDIMGRIGREVIKAILPDLKKRYRPDIIIANVENLAQGKGVTVKTIEEMRQAGIDIFTSGNHIWKKKDVYKILSASDTALIRPANYPPLVPGSGCKEIKIGKQSLFVLNLMGRVFMKEIIDCPFRAADTWLADISQRADRAGIIVDFHGEATSEKIAIKHYLDGKVSAVLGTHTHVTTADEQITPAGTAYISDVGAVLAKDSVIGVEKEGILKSFIRQIDQPNIIPKNGLGEFNGVYLEINPKSKQAVKIKRINKEINI